MTKAGGKKQNGSFGKTAKQRIIKLALFSTVNMILNS